MDIDKQVSKALLKLLVNNDDCFLANVLLGLKRVVTEDIATAAVSAKELLINEMFFKGLTEGQQQFLLLHESCHIAFYDLPRIGDKCPDIWNKACDYWINAMLIAQGHEFIDGGLYSQEFDGMEKIDIYNHLIANGLPKDQPDQDTMHGDMQGEDGEISEEDCQAIDNLVQQAAIQTRACGGKVPDDIAKYLEDLYHPKLNWKQILDKYTDQLTKDDYSYARLSRAYLPFGYAIPTLFSEGFGTFAIAIDTSGSVKDEEYATFVGGIQEIITKCNPTELKVVSFTTHITNEWTVKSLADIEQLKFRSSGGTSLKCVFEHFDKNPPEVLIIFSDMCCEHYTNKTAYDVINIVVGSTKYTGIGKTINIDI